MEVTPPEHPFYVPKKCFVKTVDLRTGDSLRTLNRKIVVIEKIQHNILGNEVKVYNFEIRKSHTYYVGTHNLSADNMCTSPPKPASPEKVINALKNYTKKLF